MLIDARLLPEDLVIEADICVVGSGPAGMSLVREFIGTDIKVCLLESGGLDVDPQAQALSEAVTTGDPFLPPQVTRHRQFGGNANIWSIKIGNGQMGVRYAPLDEIDFEQRDWLPYSGWPFSRSHLEPFYQRAQAVCQAGPFDYEANNWESETATRLPFDRDRRATTMFQFGPRNAFAAEYRDELAQAKNITVYYNATAVELQANETAQTVTRVCVATFQGHHFDVSARIFVLAKGGLENARLLLASQQQQPSGLGNQHDLVGRFFMDHPLVDGGMLIPKNPKLIDQMALYDLRQVNQVSVMGKLTPAKPLMQQEQLLNVGVLMFPRPSLRQAKAIAAFKALGEAIADGVRPDKIPTQLFSMLQGLDYVTIAAYLAATKKQSLLHGFGRGGWSELPHNERRFKMFQLFYQTEQAPHPDNRLTLTSERDVLGCQKLELHWRWRDIDAESIRRTHDLLAAEVARSGLGEIRREGSEPLQVLSPSGVAHHMGTTRMHVDPKQGVVDGQCCVHGMTNLFIAGSSVFPTGGYANPTLTIVALSLRLADRVKLALRQAAVEV
jgi:choline dehydrogenase-like flavoprotein